MCLRSAGVSKISDKVERLVVPVLSWRSVFNEFERLFGRVNYFINIHIFFVYRLVFFIKMFLQKLIDIPPVFFTHKHNRYLLGYLLGLYESYQFKNLVQCSQPAREEHIRTRGERKHNFSDKEIVKSHTLLDVWIYPLLHIKLDV